MEVHGRVISEGNRIYDVRHGDEKVHSMHPPHCAGLELTILPSRQSACNRDGGPAVATSSQAESQIAASISLAPASNIDRRIPMG